MPTTRGFIWADIVRPGQRPGIFRNLLLAALESADGSEPAVGGGHKEERWGEVWVGDENGARWQSPTPSRIAYHCDGMLMPSVAGGLM